MVWKVDERILEEMFINLMTKKAYYLEVVKWCGLLDY